MSELRSRPEHILARESAHDNLAKYIAQAQPLVRKGYFTKYPDGKKVVSDLEKEQEIFLWEAMELLKTADVSDDAFEEVFQEATRYVYSHVPEETLPLHVPQAFRDNPELLQATNTLEYYR